MKRFLYLAVMFSLAWAQFDAYGSATECEVDSISMPGRYTATQLQGFVESGATVRLRSTNTKYSYSQLVEIGRAAAFGQGRLILCIHANPRFSVYELTQIGKAGGEVHIIE